MAEVGEGAYDTPPVADRESRKGSRGEEEENVTGAGIALFDSTLGITRLLTGVETTYLTDRKKEKNIRYAEGGPSQLGYPDDPDKRELREHFAKRYDANIVPQYDKRGKLLKYKLQEISRRSRLGIPKGSYEPERDRNLSDTATRELREETGINLKDIIKRGYAKYLGDILCSLGDRTYRIYGFLIEPFDIFYQELVVAHKESSETSELKDIAFRSFADIRDYPKDANQALECVLQEWQNGNIPLPVQYKSKDN